MPSVKRSQKESLLFKEISTLFSLTAIDDKRLTGVTINRVKLSPDKSHCTVYFYTPIGEKAFNEDILEILKLYKPSLRKALASSISSRYVPELVFRFDTSYEKQFKLEQLLDKVKKEEEAATKDAHINDDNDGE